jgi:8-oxo-dGTP pyrophosphatase MutT (NUDIX family)
MAFGSPSARSGKSVTAAFATLTHLEDLPLSLASYYKEMDELKNPWTVLAKTTVYENQWIRVDHHDVRNPAGGVGPYGVVHFKGHAIGIVPIDERGNVILVGQYRFPLDYYSWEIPQGGGYPPAPIVESARRELREECGLIAKNWLEILGMDLSNSVTDERGTAFLAWDLTDGPSAPEDTEQLQVTRIPFWEAVDRAKRGEIRDSVTLASLFRIALMALQSELPPPVAALLHR